jgi:O-antigen ligase
MLNFGLPISGKHSMKMPDIVTNSSAILRSSTRLEKIDRRHVVWFSLFVLAGGVATLSPDFWLGCLAAVSVLAICKLVFVYVERTGLETWQAIALVILSGYIVLNYGFENVAIHAGSFPILITYGMIYASLALAVFAHRHRVVKALQEPAMLCVLGVLALAFFHLLTDILAYGSLAFRDATMCFDGVFLLMGLLWARKSDSPRFLAKWLLLVFVVNMPYSFTLPWAEKFWSWSPESGAFLPVPILGNYRGTGDWLLAGATFCICVGSYLISRPRWLMPVLALAQLLGIAITQVRRMYLCIVVVVIILILAGEIKKFARLFILVPAAIAVLFLATSLGGIEITGRIGPVNLEFFKDHLRSISGAEDTPGSDPQTRFIMGKQAFEHFLAHPIIGEGFGLPVVNVIDGDNGTATRTPHNSTMTYLARLGGIGFTLWVAFHICILTRFAYVYRQRRSCDKQLYAFLLWFFLFYVVFMVGSFVESPFEYPAHAIPFYFLMGYALGLIRWRLPAKKTGEQRLATLSNVEKAYS